jgi:hypothetical protein
MIADRLDDAGRGLRSLTRGQLSLRLLVLAAPLVALSAGFAAADGWSLWLTLLVIVAAIECATRPESHLGLAVVVVLALYWLGAVDDVRTAWTLAAGVAIAVFHAAMAAAAVAGPAGRWSRAMRARWLGRFATVVGLTATSWCLEVVLAGAQIRGTVIVLLAAMAALTATALALRARSLQSP